LSEENHENKEQPVPYVIQTRYLVNTSYMTYFCSVWLTKAPLSVVGTCKKNGYEEGSEYMDMQIEDFTSAN